VAVVHLSALLRPLAGGAAKVNASGTTVREVIGDLVRQFPTLEGRILDDGGIRPEILLAVGADEIFDLNQPVGPDSEVHVLPAMAGG
jgi:sulfur-carrier protein